MERQHYCKSLKLVDLPIEILLDIFLRLPTKSLLQVLCVSKTLCNQMHSPPLAAALRLETRVMILTRNRFGSKSMTLKALKYDDDGDDNDYSDDDDDELVSDILSIERRFKPEFVACGLFCFVDKETLGDPALLFNPLKAQVLRLPPSKVEGHDCKFEWYGMGFDYVTSTYKIVRVSGMNEDCMVTQILVLGTSSWRQIPSVPPCDLGLHKHMVFAYGDMHWLIGSFDRTSLVRPCYGATVAATNQGPQILTFNFKKEEFIWTPHPNFLPNSMLHLLNLQGSLAIVEASISELRIWVLKNYDKKEWAQDYNINVQFPPSHLHRYVCHFTWRPPTCFIGAWEHGIFLRDDDWLTGTVLFYDLRCGQMRDINFRTPIVNENWAHPTPFPNIYTYAGSLISLKDYDSLRIAGEAERNFFNGVKRIRARRSCELLL